MNYSGLMTLFFVIWFLGAVACAIWMNQWRDKLIEVAAEEGASAGIATAAIVVMSVLWPIFLVIILVRRVRGKGKS